MEQLLMILVGVVLFQLLIIFDLKKRNKILYHNYQTALKILAETDPKLKEYLERGGNK